MDALVSSRVEYAVDVIRKIVLAARTVRQNKLLCEELASHVSAIGVILPRLSTEPTYTVVSELCETLCMAHELVLASQNRRAIDEYFGARGPRADQLRFSRMNARIDCIMLYFVEIVPVQHASTNRSFVSTSANSSISDDDDELQQLESEIMAVRLSPPPRRSSFGSQSCEDGESSQQSEGISILLPSSGMTDHVSELNALKGILIDANAEPIRLSYPFICSMTGNFSKEIGRGGFGIVYQGDVGTSRKVAVKKLSISQSFSETLFLDEIKCLMKAKHNNIVRFLAYCSDTYGELVLVNGKHVMSELPQRLLCFDYVPNGNLGKYLQDKSCKDEWKIHYQMIRGICHGLNYLHDQRIIHLDLKPDNILLDACMEPKIADFGISRCFDEGVSRVYTKAIRGTMGSIAPETINYGEISFKSDIYGLGFIIIKLLTRCNYIDSENWRTSLDMDDPQIMSLAEIAQTCVHMDQHKRPTICEIVQKLDEIESP